MSRFGLLDAQYYLTRNSLVFGGNVDIPKLLSSFLMSIYKLNKVIQAGKLILLWDSPPYIKSLEGITEYKKDRVFASDEIKRITEELKKPDLTEEERSALEKELEKQKIKDNQYRVRTQVRKILLEEGGNVGLPSLKIQGLEADDLAYFGSKVITENFLDEDSQSYIVSSDSDWEAFATPRCDFYRSIKQAYTVNFSSVQSEGLSPFIYRQLKDVYYGNHNNLSGEVAEVKDVEFSKVIDVYKQGKLPETYPEFYKYFDALNMEKHYDTYKDNILRVIKFSGQHDLDGFFKFVRRHKLDFYPNVTKAFYKYLTPNDYRFL